MKYILKPSLERTALIKIVTVLWRQKDIRNLISNFSDSLFFEWQNIENEVIKKIPLFPVPGILKEKIKNFVKPIGLQILKWMRYHCTGGYLHTDLLAELCWSSQGTIDKKKTAEAIVKNGKLDILKCFKLACIYCLKDDIVQLWNQMPESCRLSLSSEYSSDVSQHLMRFHWTHRMQVGFNDPLYSYQYILESCAKGGNKTATEYFLQKLTLSEKEKFLVTIATCVEDAEVLFFLLSQMDEEQEEKVFKIVPKKVLLCLLDWPFQTFFIEVVDRVWEFLSEEDFDHLLKKIMDKIREGYKDYNYEKLFEKFWKKSPSRLKKYIINPRNTNFLPYLFQIKDKDKFKFLFQDATFTEKKKFIYSCTMQNFCKNFILRENWDLLRFLIQECLPLENEKIKFKEVFESNIADNRFGRVEYFTKNKHEWDKLFFSSDIVSKNNKREFEEEGERRPSKLPHIMQ